MCVYICVYTDKYGVSAQGMVQAAERDGNEGEGEVSGCKPGRLRESLHIYIHIYIHTHYILCVVPMCVYVCARRRRDDARVRGGEHLCDVSSLVVSCAERRGWSPPRSSLRQNDGRPSGQQPIKPTLSGRAGLSLSPRVGRRAWV